MKSAGGPSILQWSSSSWSQLGAAPERPGKEKATLAQRESQGRSSLKRCPLAKLTAHFKRDGDLYHDPTDCDLKASQPQPPIPPRKGPAHLSAHISLQNSPGLPAGPFASCDAHPERSSCIPAEQAPCGDARRKRTPTTAALTESGGQQRPHSGHPAELCPAPTVSPWSSLDENLEWKSLLGG